MFGKFKDDNDQPSIAIQQSQSPAPAEAAERVSADQISSISRSMTVVGKIVDEGTVHVFGQIEAERHALTILIEEGAKVEGDLVAQELTIGGTVKGTIHANRVRLNSTAVVEGDIFHRSLSIEENARFEGLSKREDNAGECRAPYCSTRRLTATSRQSQPPSRAMGNPMGRQATMNSQRGSIVVSRDATLPNLGSSVFQRRPDSFALPAMAANERASPEVRVAPFPDSLWVRPAPGPSSSAE